MVIIAFLVLFIIMGIVSWIFCIRSLRSEYSSNQQNTNQPAANQPDSTVLGEENRQLIPPRQVKRQEGKSNLRVLM